MAKHCSSFAFLAIFLLSTSAFAHGIHITASTDGKTINGRVTYQGGNSLKDCKVIVLDSAGATLAETKTDEEGKFSFPAEFRCDYHIQAKTDDGHGSEYLLKSSLLPSDLPPRENLPKAAESTSQSAHQHAEKPGDENPWTVEQIRLLQAKMDLLQEKLDAQDKSIRLRDILGGLGYIFGVFGLYALAVNYRKKNRV